METGTLDRRYQTGQTRPVKIWGWRVPREGNGSNKDGKHYWLTPPELMESLQLEFNFDYDACPYPRPEGYDGLTAEWGNSTYVNPPFSGPTGWARKAIEEHKKGKTVVMVFPTDKWIHYLLKAGAELRSLGDVRWHAVEDGSAGRGIGRYTMAFILRGKKCPPHQWDKDGERCLKCGDKDWM